MSNWKEYDMDDYIRRRDEELKQKQEFEREMAKKRAGIINRDKQLYGRRDNESTEEYKKRLRKMGFNEYAINEFINNTHPLLYGKPDV